MTDRTMPYNEAAEKCVIASVLTDPMAPDIAGEMLTGADFLDKKRGIVFDAVMRLSDDGRAIDPFMVSYAAPEVTSAEVREMSTFDCDSTHIKDYAEAVRNKSTLRNIITATREIENECYENDADAGDVVDSAERRMTSLLCDKHSKAGQTADEVFQDTLNDIRKAAEAGDVCTGVPTGFKDLDYLTSGFQNSDFVLVAARPSMGKTAFVLNSAAEQAFHQRKNVLIFSLEMPAKQLMKRMISMQARISSDKLRTGSLTAEEWDRIQYNEKLICGSGLVIDDTPGLTVREIRSRCRRVKAERGLDIVYIDYLQLMEGTGKSESRQQEISQISRRLKDLARELDIPVITLSQLSRAPEQRTDHRPILSDLRESGAIEQDADIVMFLYRDSYYKKEKKDDDKTDDTNDNTEKPAKQDGGPEGAELIVAKHRNGALATIDLVWHPEYTRFYDTRIE